MNRLNVLFLNSWYPNKIKPQNGNFIQEHARAVSLYTNVISLQIQGVFQDKELDIVTTKNENVLEITVYYKAIKGDSFLIKKRKKKRQHNAFLKGLEVIISRDFKIDIVHLNVTFPAGLFALYLKKKYQIPFIITEHSTAFLKENTTKIGIVEKIITKKITQQAAVICPVSTLLKSAMIDFGIKGKYQVIPNVINTLDFNYKQKTVTKKFNILHVSSLKNKHKNYKGILRSIKELSIKRQDFKLTIMSSSAMDNAILYAKEIKLSEKFVQFEIGNSTKIVASAMQKSKLFVLFSNYETFSLVVAESLVCGTPVIATNVGIVNEIITEKNGLIVSRNNENELIQKINNLLNDYTKFDCQKISENAINLYSYQTVGKQFVTLYNKIVN